MYLVPKTLKWLDLPHLMGCGEMEREGAGREVGKWGWGEWSYGVIILW